MKCGIISAKKQKLWVIKAVDSSTDRTVAWVLGKRDQKTFKRLYDKVKHLKKCVFYTDSWNAFAKVLPKDRHIIGKSHTHIIESYNSNTRHYLGIFTRKTKIVSRSENAVDLSLKLWQAFTLSDIFQQFRRVPLSIYFWELLIIYTKLAE